MTGTDTDGFVENLIADLTAIEERIDDLEESMDRVSELEERVHRLEERTDMLRQIEQADQTDASQRRAALWQHCVRAAQNTPSSRVAMDRSDVEEALHYPDIHRTMFYEDMRQVASQTSGNVAEYVSQDESQTGEAELRVDLTDIDDSVNPLTLHEGGE